MLPEVYNRLKVIGPEEIIANFEKANPTLDFQKIVPLHEGATEDTALENWGTQSNSYNFKKGKEPGTYRFQTISNPPEPIFIQLSRDYPELVFTNDFIHDGWDYAGSSMYEIGDSDDVRVPVTPEFYKEIYGYPMDADDIRTWREDYIPYLAKGLVRADSRTEERFVRSIPELAPLLAKNRETASDSAAWKAIAGWGAGIAGLGGLAAYLNRQRQQGQ